MPSTYTPSGVELIGSGEKSGTWGTSTNVNLQIIDRMVSQAGVISLSGTSHTLTISNGVLSDGQYGVLVFGGTPSGTNTVTISPNDAQRIYFVKNASGQTVVLTQGSGGNVSVANGKTAIVYCDGAGSGAAVVDLTATLAVPSTDLSSLGVTASAAELNTLDGITATTAELNILDGVTSTAAELNLLDGVTWTLTDYNTLTATAAELNYLGGVTGRSGADTTLVTGTAGTDGQYAQWNADGDVVGATIPTLAQSAWETGTDTTEALVSPEKVTAAISAQEQQIGVGQTWQDVSGSRAASSTSHRNTTGKPIMVNIHGNASLGSVQVSADGSTWVTVAIGIDTSDDRTTVSFIVPDNHYYRITGSGFQQWAELR